MLRRRRRSRALRCGYCRATFAADDAVCTCTCGVATHPDCLEELGRCPTLGCGGFPVAPEGAEPHAHRLPAGQRFLPDYPTLSDRLPARGGMAWFLPILFALPSFGLPLSYLVDPPAHAPPGFATWGAAALALVWAAAFYVWAIRRGRAQIRSDRAQWEALGVASRWDWPALPWERDHVFAANAAFPALPGIALMAVSLGTFAFLPLISFQPTGQAWQLAAILAAAWGGVLGLRGWQTLRGVARVGFEPPLRVGQPLRLEVSLPAGFGRRAPLRCALRCLVERFGPGGPGRDPEVLLTSVALRWQRTVESVRPASGPWVFEVDLPVDVPAGGWEAFVPGAPRDELVRWELEVQEVGRGGWGYLFPLPLFGRAEGVKE